MLLKAEYLTTDPSISRLTEDGPTLPDRLLIYGAIGLTSFFTGGFAIVFPLTYLAYRRGKKRYLQLDRHGILLDGEIIDIKTYKHNEWEFLLVVKYRFKSPTGLGLIGKQEQKRHDIKDISTLPKPGATVKILYADDRNYVIL